MALLIIGSHRVEEFYETTKRLAPDKDVRKWPDVGDPGEIRHALAWHPPAGELAKLPNLRSIISVGAGVDHLFTDPELPSVPVIRYIDPDLTGRMVEYITLHTLFHTRRMIEYRDQQMASHWQYLPEPAAQQIRVGIMGIGVLGGAAARVLKALGYQVRGWSRTPKTIDGVECFAGNNQRDDFLANTDILAVLLPYTPETRGIINRDLLAKLSREARHERLPGPVLINAGRGGLQVETGILAALDANELYAASLDVFETEPLPKESPLWQHPRVVITPHNAAESAPDSITAYFLRHVERMDKGEPLENVVDPAAGY